MEIEKIQLPPAGDLGFSPGPAGDQGRLEAVAREFEAFLLEAMLRSMRNTLDEEGEETGFGRGIYADMMYTQLARAVSQKSDLGVSRVVQEAVEKRQASSVQAAGQTVDNASATWPQSAAPTVEASSLSVPVSGRVSSQYGWRMDPLDGMRKFHRGVDIAARAGTPIQAAEEGVVVFSGKGPQYGHVVVLEHSDGTRTLYAHLAEREVVEGDRVSRWQTIGKVGSSGRATGPHLHFEVYEAGAAVDPLSRLSD